MIEKFANGKFGDLIDVAENGEVTTSVETFMEIQKVRMYAPCIKNAKVVES